MPILDTLLRPNAKMKVDLGYDKSEIEGHVDPALQKQLRECVRVRGPWQSRSEVTLWEDYVKTLGPVKLPFPKMWFEYDLTDGDGEVLNVGVLVDEAKSVLGEDCWMARTFLRPAMRKLPISFNCTLMVKHEPDGTYRNEFVFDNRKYAESEADNDQDALVESTPIQAEINATLNMCAPALQALGLMNCKNVTTERHSRKVKPRKRSKGAKKSKSQAPSLLDYHTIVLPGKVQAATYGDEETSDGSVVRFHKVRGHFRTYTAEKPLMGRHVGTYWFAPHVRGDKEAGKVVSDYRVENPVLQSSS